MMGPEMVPEMSVSSCNQLTRLCAREDFIEFSRRESFKLYISSHLLSNRPIIHILEKRCYMAQETTSSFQTQEQVSIWYTNCTSLYSRYRFVIWYRAICYTNWINSINNIPYATYRKLKYIVVLNNRKIAIKIPRGLLI
jgi:hypothetical protein